MRDLHLAEYWAVVAKRRAIVAACVVLCLSGALLRAFLSPPLYRATVILTVEKDRAGPLDFGIPASPLWDPSPELVPTQTRLLRSAEVGERVVRKLNLAENPAFNPPRPAPAAASRQGKAPADPLEPLVVRVLGMLSTAPVRGTSLVELSAVSRSQQLARDVAMAAATSFVEWNVENKFRVVGQASQFLAAQIEQLKADVDDRERRLQAYRRSKDIVSMDPKANVTLQKLETLNKEYAAAVAERVSREAKWSQMREASNEAIAESIAGQSVQQLRNDLLKLEREYAERLNLFKPDWPAMQQLRAQMEKARQSYESVVEETAAKARESARNDYQTTLRREETLKGILHVQSAEAMTLNSTAVEYNNLVVEVTTKRTLLDTLLKRQSETEVSSRLSGARQPNVRVVDRVLPYGTRFSPSYRRSASLGLFVGLAVGVGLAFLLEYMDRSLRTEAQVHEYLGLPALGIIPTIGARGRSARAYGVVPYGRRLRGPAAAEAVAAEQEPAVELLPHQAPRSVGAEAYRAFRAALLLSRAGGVRTIVVTSGYSGEGKTSSAANLAIVLSQQGGRRVLLVDTDLHKPRQHQVFGVSNRVGVVSILAEGLPLAQALQRTPISGLTLLPAGPAAPNPSGLMSDEGISRLLAQTRESFDFVVLDTPPIQAISDALVLGSLSDGVVLCVKAGVTPREQVARVRDRLLMANVRILGVLLNAAEETGSGYGSYGAYGGYGSEGGSGAMEGPVALAERGAGKDDPGEAGPRAVEGRASGRHDRRKSAS